MHSALGHCLALTGPVLVFCGWVSLICDFHPLSVAARYVVSADLPPVKLSPFLLPLAGTFTNQGSKHNLYTYYRRCTVDETHSLKVHVAASPSLPPYYYYYYYYFIIIIIILIIIFIIIVIIIIIIILPLLLLLLLLLSSLSSSSSYYYYHHHYYYYYLTVIA